MTSPLDIWRETPLIHSPFLSRAAGCQVYLKLENVQVSGSFKGRGIGLLMKRAWAKMGGRELKEAGEPGEPKKERPHFYCSSGGNAGMAAVDAATKLGCLCTIVVPFTTSPLMKDKLLALGAHVLVHGTSWSEADLHLRLSLLAHDPRGIYVPPFDHPDIWDGNASLIDEIVTQLPNVDALVCCIGGGGLFAGIMVGLEKNGLLDTVRVLAMETVGADSLYQSIEKSELVTLPAITSIATSLGAVRVCGKAFEYGQLRTVKSRRVTDAQAAMAAVRFADEERMLLEVACGASLAPVYGGELRKVFGEGQGEEEWKEYKVVVVVCGGNNVTVEMVEGWRQVYGLKWSEGNKLGRVGEVGIGPRVDCT